MKPRAFKRIWGKPWDFGYLLDLEKAKIKEICTYIKRHKSHADYERSVREMEICIRLIDIIQEDDVHYKSWLNANYGLKPEERWTSKGITPFSIYVNTRNILRFMPQIDKDFKSKHPIILENIKISLRQQKALYLYNKIRAYCMQKWWD